MRGITSLAAFAAVASATFGKEHHYRNTTIATTTKVPQTTVDKTVYTTLTTCPVTLTQHEGNKTYVTTKLTTKTLTLTSCKGGCHHPPPTVVHPQPTPSIKTIDTTVYETLTTCPVTLTYTHDGKPTTITRLTTSTVTITSCKGGCHPPPTHAPAPPHPQPPVSMPSAQPPKPSSPPHNPPQNSPQPPVSMPQAQPPKPSAPVVNPPAAPNTCPPAPTVTVTVTAYVPQPPQPTQKAPQPQPPQPTQKPPQPQPPQPTQKAPEPHPPVVNPSRPAGQPTPSSRASVRTSSPVASPSATPKCDPCQLQFNQCRQPSANGTSANQSFCSAQNAFCQSNARSGFTISSDCATLFNRCRAPGGGVSGNQAFCAAQNLACTQAIERGFRPPPACPPTNSTSSAVRSSTAIRTPSPTPSSVRSSSAVYTPHPTPSRSASSAMRSSSSVVYHTPYPSPSATATATTPYIPATTNTAYLQCRRQSDACRGAPDWNFSFCNSQAAGCCADAFDKCRAPSADGTSANQAYCGAENVACYAYAGILDLIQPLP